MLSRRHAALAVLALCSFAGSALAHGPTRQKVVEKIAIDAPADAVWAVIKDFDGLSKWHPAVEASPARKLYICNLMTKKNETPGFTVSRFISTIELYLASSLMSLQGARLKNFVPLFQNGSPASGCGP